MQKNLLAVEMEQPVLCKQQCMLTAAGNRLMLLNRQSTVLVPNTNNINCLHS